MDKTEDGERSSQDGILGASGHPLTLRFQGIRAPSFPGQGRLRCWLSHAERRKGSSCPGRSHVIPPILGREWDLLLLLSLLNCPVAASMSLLDFPLDLHGCAYPFPAGATELRIAC